ERDGAPAHVVVRGVEPSAVREASPAFTAVTGGSITTVGVDRLGRVDPDEVDAAIRPDTALVHVQWANHEVGTVQPVAEVVARCRARGVLVHVDAAQAVGPVPVSVHEPRADPPSFGG